MPLARRVRVTRSVRVTRHVRVARRVDLPVVITVRHLRPAAGRSICTGFLVAGVWSVSAGACRVIRRGLFGDPLRGFWGFGCGMWAVLGKN